MSAIQIKCPIYLTGIYFYAQSNVEQLGEVYPQADKFIPERWIKKDPE
jgi:hypothetical protein